MSMNNGLAVERLINEVEANGIAHHIPRYYESVGVIMNELEKRGYKASYDDFEIEVSK